METLAFNGITATIGGDYHLANIEGLLIGGIEFSAFNIPQSNKAGFVSNFAHSKVISIDIAVRGSDMADFYLKRQALLKAIYPATNQEVSFVYTTEDSQVYTFKGYLRTAVNEGERTGSYQTIGFSIYVPSGTITSGNLNSVTLEQTGVPTGAVLPWTLPVLLGTVSGSATLNNDGNGYATIDIEITGPGEGFTILNQTTGILFKVDGLTLTAGQKIQITGDDLTVTQSGVSIFQYVTSDSQFITLAPGNNNLALYVDSGATSDTQAVITWYNTYVGI
jgi:Phage tail protein.